MEYFGRSLAMLLVMTSFIFANGQNANDSYFIIKLGTFSTPQHDTFAEAEKLGYVYGKDLGNGAYDVFLGGYGNIIQAQAVVDAVKKQNFDQAVVETKSPEHGKVVSVVQIGLCGDKEKIEWLSLEQAGNYIR